MPPKAPTDAPAVDALRAVVTTTRRRARLEAAIEAQADAVRAAIAAGCRVADICRASGFSRPRVYQIRDHRR